MSVARTARRRRRQLSNNNHHLSGLGVSRRKQPPTFRVFSAGSAKKKRT